MRLRRPMRIKSLLLASAIAAATGAGSAWAADAPAQTAAPTDDGSSTMVEEVVVTTSRIREEALQRVPESVVVFTQDTIDKRNIQQINDVLNVTPNVSIVSAQDPGLAMISVRGISQVRNGEPPVAFVIDGVQLLSADSFTQELYDIQSIEVLKGPQGAYYGRNAMGGAIVITTKPPTNDFEGFVKAGYGNGEDALVQAAIRGPLIEDKLLFSLSASAQNFDGVIESGVLTEGGEPKKLDWIDERTVRGRLIGYLTDDLSIDLRAGYSRLDAGASYYIATDGPNDVVTPVIADELGYSDREIKDASVKVDYDLPIGRLTSITAFSDTWLFVHEDLEWLPVSILGAEQSRHTRGTTQEIRLTSPSDQRLRWMFGGYALWQDRDVGTDLLLTVVNPLDLAIPIQDTNEHGTDIALFGQVNYDITPDLELTAALRWDREHREQFDNLTGATVEETWPKLQPKLSLAYRWTPEVMLYATYGVGFRSGGFNAPGTVFPGVYEAQTATSYEIGAKTTLLDGRVRLNGALFYTALDNFQVFALTGALQGLFNVEESHMAGFELETSIRITDFFKIDAGLGYIDSQIDRYDLKGAGFEASIPVIPGQVEGNALPLTYKWSASVGAEFRHDFNVAETDWSAILRIDWTYRDGNYWSIDNTAREDARSLWDATLRFKNGPNVVAFWARNIFDKAYTEEFFPREWCCTFTGIRWPGQPRRFGVTLTRAF